MIHLKYDSRHFMRVPGIKTITSRNISKVASRGQEIKYEVIHAFNFSPHL